MTLTDEERETIVLYNQKAAVASVYTHDPKLIRKLKRLAERYPEQVYPERKEHAGAVSYIVPRNCVCIREPFSAERRQALRERAKAAGTTPPVRTAKKQ